jgi:hypothetical protein
MIHYKNKMAIMEKGLPTAGRRHLSGGLMPIVDEN